MHYTSKEVYEYISKQTNDPIVEWKTCAVSGTEFPIYQSDLEFYDKISPTFNWVKYQIPVPTLCPEERERRRLAWRNERKLYRRTCDASKKQIISIYSPDKPYKVYDQKIWWSDTRDVLKYGKEFDFSKSLFEQFETLMNVVPKLALNGHLSNENSEYTNYFIESKNCYMCFGGAYNENVLYSEIPMKCKDSAELYFSINCEACYEASFCIQCFKTYYAYNCENCHDSRYIENCHGCSYCFACTDLENASYCIYNKPVSKEEYAAHLQDYQSNPEKHLSQIKSFFLNQPKKNLNISFSENCIGNNITYSKDCSHCVCVDHAEAIKYAEVCPKIESSQDVESVGVNSSFCYEIMTASQNIYNCAFSCVLRTNCKNLYYCSDMHSSSDCFACIGLKGKQYCILNKQYSKEEYEKLVPKIIEKMKADGEWGEFFPASISPFGYNETVANIYYPITQNTKDWRFKRSNYEAPIPQSDKILEGKNLPHNGCKNIFEQAPDFLEDISKYAVSCEVTGKLFRIISQELEFYKKHNLPLPRKHPDQRYQERFFTRNPKKIFERTCDKCGKKILSIYSTESKQVTYCESCYW